MGVSLTDKELKESRLSDRKAMTAQAGGAQEISIARVTTGEGDARAWRVTLSRLDRADTHAPLAPNDVGGSSPFFTSQIYSYAAGTQATPQIPPRRSNPIFGSANPASGAGAAATFVQISWGLSQSAPNRMIAHWPSQGASIVLVGSYVEVFGAGGIFALGVPPVTEGEVPVFSAQIVPATGLAATDAGELSITQKVFLAPFDAGGLLTDGIANPGSGFEVLIGTSANPSPPQQALRASAVPNVAPFVAWAATVVSGAGQRRLVVYVEEDGGTSGEFVLLDNQVPIFGTSFFTPSAGDVGVLYRFDSVDVGTMKTIAQLEALINTSTLISVSVPSANPAFLVQEYSKVLAAGDNSGFGVGLVTGNTQGSALYVPDFARRVRVDLAEPDANTEIEMPPIAGQPACRLVWYDDEGNEIAAMFQGAIAGGSEPVAWHPVPAQAVMLGLYQAPAVNTLRAFVHWRLSP